MTGHEQEKKSAAAEREEEILKFWEEHNIFEKTLAKPSPKGEFVFYEGPPTANGRPGIHHLEARAFKDLIPRFQTMRGYHVRRKGGWDTHGLPVELEVEKELGLKTKKDIEKYGIAAFNEKCKESVWKYQEEWERFTKRIGYWIDQNKPYITYTPDYIESVWHIFKHTQKRGLVYKDYKVVPWCPRCGTALSSHELAQGYKDVSDTAVFVKFKATDSDEYFLAWTTTPWTLPGNVALAVQEDVTYVKAKIGNEIVWFAKDLHTTLAPDAEFLAEALGRELVGRTYEPLFGYLKEALPEGEQEKLAKAYTIYGADFVTTTEGTGIVHTAVMYGQDDFVLGTQVGLPKHHLVDEEGKFTEDVSEYAGVFVKDADEEIVRDLKARNLLFKEETITHTYPFCWRCKTPLIYYARDSWYIEMSKLRSELIKENQKIHWEPEHIRDGRFGEWLRDLKDWAISRSRYWGTPLPIWQCDQCAETKSIGSIEELKKQTKHAENTYLLMRHAEAVSNHKGLVSGTPNTDLDTLTEKGKEQLSAACRRLKQDDVDCIYTSPFRRTEETARAIAEHIGMSDKDIIVDKRLGEIASGELDGKPIEEYRDFFSSMEERFVKAPKDGETALDVKRRVGELLYELEQKHQGKRILIVTHEYPVWMLEATARGATVKEAAAMKEDDHIGNAEIRELSFTPLPHNKEYELDLHRPYIDEVKLVCSCGESMHRVPDVMDVWFDSGSMPFAQDHYPFEKRRGIFFRRAPKYYPADYISEGMDQTRGWFYTLHAVGSLMGFGRAYKNVISVGLINDAEGKKMSKSVGNVVSPWEQMDVYGVDVVRFWMYSINQPGETKSYDKQTVVDVERRVFNILRNIVRFYEMYAPEEPIQKSDNAEAVLDQWIRARFAEVQQLVTKHLDTYRPLEAARGIRDFVTDFSTWYIRRSRDRFRGDDEDDMRCAVETTRYILCELAKLMAPFTPFIAEDIYRRVGGPRESVHLEDWPAEDAVDTDVLKTMERVRRIVSESLEIRSATGIKVRQPLARLTIRTDTPITDDAYTALIRDEVNVKEVVFEDETGWSIELDTEITPALLREGQYRELVRGLQEARKKVSLLPNDVVGIVVTTDTAGKALIDEFSEVLKSDVRLSSISFGDGSDHTITVDEMTFTISFT